MRAKEKLSAKFVEKHSKQGRYPDGGNLEFQVSESGTKCWLFRYMRNGRTHYVGLGPYPDVSLREAREKATTNRKLLIDGLDPLEEKRKQRAEQRLEVAKSMTFGQCVEAYLEARSAEWTNSKHTAQWRMTLTEYCKHISNLPVQNIDTDLVLRVLTPHWKVRTVTAERLRGRIERVLAWAKGRGLRDGENPARWRGHLDEMLAKPSKIWKVEHHAALPYAEMPAFMVELRQRDSENARALEFLILTAARTSEVVWATWDELGDLETRTWTIPAERMKGGREHCVPLSGRAVEILKGLPRKGGRVFPLHKNAMLELLQVMRPGLAVHGLRATFRTWCAEQTNFAHEIAEAALAHRVPDATVRAYKRTTFYDRRAMLMEEWAKFCTQAPAGRANVVAIRDARH
jgi:integrase